MIHTDPEPVPATRRSRRLLVAIVIAVVALSAGLVIHQIRMESEQRTVPTLATRFADWMSRNTVNNVEISRVSCLDPSVAFGNQATCQFTAEVDRQGTRTVYHDFKCTAVLDVDGSVATVQCPDNIAWIIASRVDQ